MTERRHRTTPSSSVSSALVTLQAVLGSVLAATWLLWPMRWTWIPFGYLAPLAMICWLIALFATARAFADLGPAFRVQPQPREGVQLVRHGIYRRLRHPMYTSVCMIAVGVFLHHPGTTTFLGMLANLAFYVAKARYEESLLDKHYADYPSYRGQTYGVIPWPRWPTRT